MFELLAADGLPAGVFDDPWPEVDVEELIRRDPLFGGVAAEDDGWSALARSQLAGSQVAGDARCSAAEVLPSGFLGVELDVTTADPSRLDDADLVDAIVGFDHMTSWAQARQARLLAEFAHRRPGDAPEAANCDLPSLISRWAPDEIGLALHLSRGAAIIRLAQATQLQHVLPATLQAWEEGRIDAVKVRAICDTVRVLDDEKASRVQDRILGKATDQTAAQLRAALTRAVIAVDREGAAARHRQARKDRRVTVGQENEGMASLWAMLPAPGALSAYQWLTSLARAMGATDPRGMDARRADLLVELLTGQLTITAPTPDPGDPAPGDPAPGDPAPGDPAPGDPNPGNAGTGSSASGSAGPGFAGPQSLVPVGVSKPLVQVVMPYTTLIGADDQPCELVGYGAIPADLAREIAADAVWKRLVTDPLSGALLDHGRTTYRPPAALSDFVRARDVYCRFPTCRRRAIDAELDHTIAFATDNGDTADTNLYGGCTQHHHLKHDAPGWTVAQHPDGRITWTTPAGHRYTSSPHDYRPEPEPERSAPGPVTPTPTPAATPATTRQPSPTRRTPTHDISAQFDRPIVDTDDAPF